MSSDDQTQKMSKKFFLANTRNKSNFLAGLGKWLAESKYKVVQSPADADLIIAQTAIGLAELHSVVVVAEDTDVFGLLLHYLNVDKHHDIYFNCGLTTAGTGGMKSIPLVLIIRVCLLTLNIMTNALRKIIYVLPLDINVGFINEEYD